MTKTLVKRPFLLVLLILTIPVFGQNEQSQGREFSGVGSIVAVQRRTRHPVKPEPGGIGTYVELWIVRMDRWSSGVDRKATYILVQYDLNQRGLSDDEINRKTLQFTLRERREDEHTDCLGYIVEGNKPPFKNRPVVFSDYERTRSGQGDVIPTLNSLPCFISDKPSIVVE